MIGVVRYVASSCVAAQRWVAPVAVYAITLTAFYATGGDPLANLSIGAVALFPIAAWLTVATLNDEHRDHLPLVAAAAGGVARLRVAALLTATLVGATLALLSLAFAFARSSSSFTLADLAAGALAHASALAGGVALGALCARPLVARVGWALVAVIAVFLADVLIPDAPPDHLVLNGLNNDHVTWSALAAGAAATALLTALATAAALRATRARL